MLMPQGKSGVVVSKDTHVILRVCDPERIAMIQSQGFFGATFHTCLR